MRLRCAVSWWRRARCTPFLADHRSELFPDDMFSDLFPSGRGRPSIPQDVMASAMILKELEGLSDREAADALRCDIRWRVACGLALDDEGLSSQFSSAM
jgi:transposase